MEKNYSFIDLGYLELMSDGDAQMKSILLELLLKEPEEQLKQMQEYLTAKNWEALQFAAHKLKTSFPYTGYTSLIDRNVALDAILKSKLNGQTPDNFEEEVTTMLSDVNKYYAEALPELKDAYDNTVNTV